MFKMIIYFSFYVEPNYIQYNMCLFCTTTHDDDDHPSDHSIRLSVYQLQQ